MVIFGERRAEDRRSWLRIDNVFSVRDVTADEFVCCMEAQITELDQGRNGAAFCRFEVRLKEELEEARFVFDIGAAFHLTVVIHIGHLPAVARCGG